MKKIRYGESFTPDFLQVFEVEVRQLNTLHHPNLVEFAGAVYEEGESPNLWLISNYQFFL